MADQNSKRQKVKLYNDPYLEEITNRQSISTILTHRVNRLSNGLYSTEQTCQAFDFEKQNSILKIQIQSLQSTLLLKQSEFSHKQTALLSQIQKLQRLLTQRQNRIANLEEKIIHFQNQNIKNTKNNPVQSQQIAKQSQQHHQKNCFDNALETSRLQKITETTVLRNYQNSVNFENTQINRGNNNGLVQKKAKTPKVVFSISPPKDVFPITNIFQPTNMFQAKNGDPSKNRLPTSPVMHHPVNYLQFNRPISENRSMKLKEGFDQVNANSTLQVYANNMGQKTAGQNMIFEQRIRTQHSPNINASPKFIQPFGNFTIKP